MGNYLVLSILKEDNNNMGQELVSRFQQAALDQVLEITS